jgi:hypothetical protein
MELRISRGSAVDAHLREDVVAEIAVERIFFRKRADVFSEGSASTMAAPPTQLT